MSLVIPEDLPDGIDKPLENLLTPVATGVGKTFGDLWYLVFGGISLQANKRRIKYETAINEYKKICQQKIENVPENKRIEPDIQIVAAALEASKYCVENKAVREMFASLIASAMNSDTANLEHPSFPDIIKQLNPFDAWILHMFIVYRKLPICEYISADSENKYYVLFTNVFLEGHDENTVFDNNEIEKRATSIEALEHLGLIKVDYNSHIAIESHYDIFYRTQLFMEYKTNEFNRNRNVKIRKGAVSLTILGKRLLSVCCPAETIYAVQST